MSNKLIEKVIPVSQDDPDQFLSHLHNPLTHVPLELQSFLHVLEAWELLIILWIK